MTNHPRTIQIFLPSGAAGVLLQSASNGWVDWKTTSGVTLREYQEQLLR